MPVLGLAPGTGRADTIHLSDGRRIEGTVIEESADRLDVLTRGGRLTISGAKTKWRIERDTAANNTLREADSALRRGSLDDAEKLLREAMSEGTAAEEVRRWCVAHGKSVAKAFETARASDAISWSELVRALTGLTTATISANPPANPPSVPGGWTTATLYRCQADALQTTASLPALPPQFAASDELRDFIELTAPLLAPTEERQVVIALLERLDPATLHDVVAAVPVLEPLLIRDVSQRLAEADFLRARLVMRLMDTAGMESVRSCRILAALRWSSLARETLQYDAALTALRTCVVPALPSLGAERMVATLADARVRLAAQGRFAEAIGLYEQWGPSLPDANVTGTVASLYLDWGTDLLVGGQPAEARVAFTEYLRRKPDGDAQTLDRCEFEERLAALKPGEYSGAFLLGRWAAEHGLVPQAIKAFERAAQREELREPATEQISLLRQNAARTHLDLALAWIERGEPGQALTELGKFMYYPETRTLQPEIQRLRKVCHTELARRAQLRPVQAEALYQDAERKFGLGERASAVANLRAILKDYPETPTAVRAREFLAVASAHMLLESLEGSASNAPGGGHPLAVGATRGSEYEVRGLLHDLGQGADAEKAAVANRPSSTPGAADSPSPIDAPEGPGEAGLF